MKKLLITLGIVWLTIVSLMVIFPNITDLLQSKLFGTTSFPTSLDTTTTLPNPGATDSVATVSHSTLHTNENGSIEAIEAKLGIGASTASNNTIFVGNGAGTSLFSTSASSTNFFATNFLTASSTIGSTSIATLLATSATTTDLYIGNLASSTNFRANVENIGKSTINALTVTSCTGCAIGGTTIYYATSSNASVHVKSLSLLSGDVVVMSTGQEHNTNHGVLSYKIISPGPDATTTLYSDGGSAADTITGATFSFLATTTETVRFYWSPGVGPTAFTLFVQSNSYANQF